ncbi:MAG: Asp-tRNA(Asn)/Glu-tRNA(Gln) amidotransferase subunit GatC [Helicobacteraceae bacterium]|jgi:aspartyl-tRNA(Asn)/glutamyl-tRNA(Gln) amidotransferase subunit C|nr:Asp-tRNA(Asn)/Glu-tRNA(Gln) amidotransferase subunit GatC [Helicobacteraceae bacterium]
MIIDDALLKRLETLAQLTIAPDKRDATKQSLSEILGFVDKLNELDTSHIDALSSLFDVASRLRADEPNENPSVFSDLIKHAPKADGRGFVAPRVVG